MEKNLVIGLGGGGVNMTKTVAPTLGFLGLAIDTDSESANWRSFEYRLLIGEGGASAGRDPEMGRRAAEAASQKIACAIRGHVQVVLLVGMGGGTGTNGAPVVVGIAQSLGIPLLVGVTLPFTFEGKMRSRIADQGVQTLHSLGVDLLVQENDSLISDLGSEVTMMRAFQYSSQCMAERVAAWLLQKHGS